MSLGDAFSDAVSDIDHYLRDGSGTAWPGNPWWQRVVDCRNEMEHLRCLVDAAALGVPLDQADNGFRPLDLSDPDDEEGGDDGD